MRTSVWLTIALGWLTFGASVRGEVPRLGEVATLGHGPTTLLAIPCAFCRWRSSHEFAERNADRFTTIAVTLPGYGGSRLPDVLSDFAAATFAADTAGEGVPDP